MRLQIWKIFVSGGGRDDDKLDGNKARGLIAGKSKEINFICIDESETEVNILLASNADFINSPIKPAIGWAVVPKDAKEFTLLTSSGFVRRLCLLLKNEAGEYDTVAIYKNKSAVEPLFTVKKGVLIGGYQDEVVDKNGEVKMASRSVLWKSLRTAVD